MTEKELSKVYWIDMEIETDRKKVKELEEQIKASSPILSDMPRKSRTNESRVEKLAVELADLKAAIVLKQIECVQEKKKLYRYIAGIPDSMMRMIYTSRHIDGLSWGRVALSIGCGCTKESVKVAYRRYLDKTQEAARSTETDAYA